MNLNLKGRPTLGWQRQVAVMSMSKVNITYWMLDGGLNEAMKNEDLKYK